MSKKARILEMAREIVVEVIYMVIFTAGFALMFYQCGTSIGGG